MKKHLSRRLSGFESLESRHMLATYFVDSVSGTDLQAVGSIDKPFQTIARATLFAQPGDTVVLREGVYREQVNMLRSGTPENPITFVAYEDEDVLVTTTEPLTGWTHHSGNIYKASFDSSIFGRNNLTLFVDDQLMTEAHWSDKGGNIDVLDSSQWSTMEGGSLTTITDTALAGMPNGSWVGGFVYTKTSAFTVETRRVVDFTSNASSGTLVLERALDRNAHAGLNYLIFNNLAALDAPGEWYFDTATDTVYLWAPEGGNPDDYAVEIKHRPDAFNLNGRDYIHIIGIDMRGGDLNMEGSDGILLQGARIEMPDYGFGPEGSGGARALVVTGDHNVIRDTEFASINGVAIHLEGSHNAIVNNYFHDIGLKNANGAAVNLRPGSTNNLISHNTITRVGRAAIGGNTERAVIQYNDFSQVGLTTQDGAALYFGNVSLGNTEIHHNVFHDISGVSMAAVYTDHRTTDLLVHHNIIYNVTPAGGRVNLPTSFVLWFNNTLYNSGNIDAWFPAGSSTSALGSKFFNNILSSIDSDLFNSPDQAEASHNLQTVSANHFINAAAGDFRLTAGSAAVDAGRTIPGITNGFTGTAPDIGALELGQPMFVVGHDFDNPPQPIYQWQLNYFANHANNGGFELGIQGWKVEAGAARVVFGNGWNYRGEGHAVTGNYGLAMDPDSRVSQTLTNLRPNTTYVARVNARLLGPDIQAENYDGHSGTFTTPTIREEQGVGSLNAGEWLRYDNIDFGDGTALYDRIEIGITQNSAFNLQIRVDDPVSGPVLGTIAVKSHAEPWWIVGTNIPAITGERSLYLVPQGNAGNGVIDRIRLVRRNTDEYVRFGVEGHGGSADQPVLINSAYWSEPLSSIEFTTGPTSTSATVFLETGAGYLTAYIDDLSLAASSNQPAPLAPADFNGDGQVDGADLAIWQSAYGKSVLGDANGDGNTDGRDFLMWQRGVTVSPAASTSPDPVPLVAEATVSEAPSPVMDTVMGEASVVVSALPTSAASITSEVMAAEHRWVPIILARTSRMGAAQVAHAVEPQAVDDFLADDYLAGNGLQYRRPSHALEDLAGQLRDGRFDPLDYVASGRIRMAMNNAHEESDSAFAELAEAIDRHRG